MRCLIKPLGIIYNGLPGNCLNLMINLVTASVPRSFSSSTNDFDANCGPQSEIILSGSPNCLYRLLSKSFAVSSAVIVLLQGRRITPLLRPWSTTTRMESKFRTEGKSVMKSMEQ